MQTSQQVGEDDYNKNVMKIKRKDLDGLVDWFVLHCDGLWEHSNGFEIGTLDNPGISLRISLAGTSLCSVKFDKHEFHPDGDDSEPWYVCEKNDEQFMGFCSPEHISTIINIFLTWSNEHAQVDSPSP